MGSFANPGKNVWDHVGASVSTENPGTALWNAPSDSPIFNLNLNTVDRYLDVSYGNAAFSPDGNTLIGDWFLPKKLARPNSFEFRGVIIAIHGGGWQCGRDHATGEIRQYAANMAARGWAVFNAEYHRGEYGNFRQVMKDINIAVAYVKGIPEERGTFERNLNRTYSKIAWGSVALAGESAGGNIALMASLIENDPAKFDPIVGFSAPADPSRSPIIAVSSTSGVMNIADWYIAGLGSHNQPAHGGTSPYIYNSPCPKSTLSGGVAPLDAPTPGPSYRVSAHTLMQAFYTNANLLHPLSNNDWCSFASPISHLNETSFPPSLLIFNPSDQVVGEFAYTIMGSDGSIGFSPIGQSGAMIRDMDGQYLTNYDGSGYVPAKLNSKIHYFVVPGFVNPYGSWVNAPPAGVAMAIKAECQGSHAWGPCMEDITGYPGTGHNRYAEDATDLFFKSIGLVYPNNSMIGNGGRF